MSDHDYLPVKTEFAALCARLNLSQGTVADLVPCRLDTVKKWQSGKMKVRPEVLAHLHNMDDAIRRAAMLIAAQLEEFVEADGRLLLEVPPSFGPVFGGSRDRLHFDSLQAIVRPFYGEVSYWVAGQCEIEMRVGDVPYDNDNVEAGRYPLLTLLSEVHDASIYWRKVRPETEVDAFFKPMPLEVWRDLTNRLENFETASFTLCSIPELFRPNTSMDDSVSGSGVFIEWVGPTGFTYALDIGIFPNDVTDFRHDENDFMINEALSTNISTGLVAPEYTGDDPQEGMDQLEEMVLAIFIKKFGTVDALMSAVKRHPDYEDANLDA